MASHNNNETGELIISDARESKHGFVVPSFEQPQFLISTPIEHKSAAEAYICQLSSLQSQQTARRVLARIARVFCGIEETNIEVGKLLSDARQQAIQRDQYLIEHYPWGRMSKDLIVATLNKIVKDRKEPLSPNTHRLYLSLLKGVTRIALEKKQMNVETFQIIQTIKAGRGSRLPKGRPLTQEEQIKSLEACETDTRAIGVRDTAILELFLSAGLRRIELVKIQMNEIDWVERSIVINGKGNKQRKVWMTDTAYTALRNWVDNVRGEYPGPLFCRIRVGDDVRINEEGLHPQSINYILKTKGQLAEVAALKPHNLRRTLATEMDHEGINIRLIQLTLGHDAVATTERYIFSDDSRVKEAMMSRTTRKKTTE